jgi:hypothetical protein
MAAGFAGKAAEADPGRDLMRIVTLYGCGLRISIVALGFLSLAACGGSGSSGPPPPANNPPVLAGIEGGSLAYTEKQAPEGISAGIIASDADNTTLAGATVQVTGNYANGEDVLAFTNTAGIAGAWSAATGTLSLSGTDTVANYELALRAVTYGNTSNNPSTAARTVAFTVTDGSANSNTVSRTIAIAAVNDPPVLAGIEAGALSYIGGQPATAITGALTASDVDNTTLAGASVQITANYTNGEDLLAFTNTGGITGNWNAATGTLSLTGTDTVAHYQAALRAVKYSDANSSPNTATRTVTFAANDGSVASNSAVRDINVSTGTVSIALHPRATSVTTSQTEVFSASVTVTGGATNGISWSVDGVGGGNSAAGTISANGLYTPGTGIGAHTVRATSQWDGTTSATASVAVTDLSGVFTWHNDAGRTGQNRQEYALTPASVSASTFGRRFSCAVDGQLYAQPVYVANLTISGGKHNVVYVATEHDSVYAFDADAAPCVTYWQKSFLGAGVTTVPAVDTNETGDLSPEFGITSTPVIDPATSTLYVLARTKESGNYFQRLHALDVTTGQEKFGGPVVVQASVPGTGTGSVGNTITFDPLIQNQRSALLLLNGVVYIAWASHGDQGNYHGWLMGYNATTLARVATYNATPNADEAGIWMSGNGPAADSTGSIYVITGNGGFDAGNSIPLIAPNNDLGDAFIRLSSGAGLAVADYFTPFNQSGLSASDWDLGSSGAVVVPDGIGPVGHRNLLVGGDKEGKLYVLDRQNLGKFTNGGPDQVVQTLTFPGGCVTCGLFTSPVIWQTGANSATMYAGAVGDTLNAYPLSGGQFPATPASATAESYGFPGPAPSISSNAATNGVVWVLDTTHNGSGNSTPPAGPVVLRAYDATDLQHRLYSSDAKAADAAGVAVKFAVPVIANGKVYVVGDGVLTVYGLLP